MSTPETPQATSQDSNGAEVAAQSGSPTPPTRARRNPTASPTTATATATATTLQQPQQRRRRPGQRMSAAEKELAQKLFLRTFAQTGNATTACKAAHINRDTLYWWKEHDLKFSLRLHQAEADASDTLRAEAFRRAVLGVEEPVVSAGQLVYEMIEVIDPATGLPVLDRNGKPVYRRGKMMTVRKYSDTLLASLLKARCDEFRPPQRVEVSGQDGAPIQTEHRAVFVLPVPVEADEE